MRAIRPVAFAIALAAGHAACLAPSGAFAQAKAPTADVAPQPVVLTQAQIDHAIATQKEFRAFEAKQPQRQDDKADPAAEAQLDMIVKKNGFADATQWANVSAMIGAVMAGIDPETKAYIGPVAVIKKQIAEIQGDAKMPAKEKKEALDELNAALKTATMDKPSPANIELVSKNFDALSQGMEAE